MSDVSSLPDVTMNDFERVEAEIVRLQQLRARMLGGDAAARVPVSDGTPPFEHSRDASPERAHGGHSSEKKLRFTAKLADPPQYHGKRGQDPADFLFAIEEVCDLTDTRNDMEKIRYAGQYLRESARVWYKALRLSGKLSQPTATWEWFKKELRAHFLVRDPVELAREELFDIQQTRGVREYTARFRHLSTMVETMHESDLLGLYIKRLKPEVQKHVRSQKPVDLEDAFRHAEIYVSIHGDEKGGNGGRWRGGHQSSYPSDPAPRASRRDEATPMELGVMEKRSKKNGVSKEEMDRRRENDLCFECGSPDHRVAECPKKKNGKPKQGNGHGRQPERR